MAAVGRVGACGLLLLLLAAVMFLARFTADGIDTVQLGQLREHASRTDNKAHCWCCCCRTMSQHGCSSATASGRLLLTRSRQATLRQQPRAMQQLPQQLAQHLQRL